MRVGLLALSIATLPALASAATTPDNQTVLAQFAQATGQVGHLTKGPDGELQISWEGGLSADWYHRRTTAEPLLTPFYSGTFGRLEWHSDLRGTDRNNRVSWLQFSGGLGDDRAVFPVASGQVRHFSAGQAGERHRVALGDIPVEHSTLGVFTPLRGVLAEAIFAEGVLASFAAGTLAESWEALADAARRTLYRRDVFAFKLATSLSSQGQVFLTAQSYADQGSPGTFQHRFGWLPAALPRTQGKSATLGFQWRQGAWFAQGEVGAGRWQEEGEPAKHDHAFILDAGWQGERLAMRMGHHDIGRFYGLVSAQGATGVVETYLNGSWAATQQLALTLDVRRSENDMARPPVPAPPITVPPTPSGAPTPFAGQTDSTQLSARYMLTTVPGLALSASAGESRARNEATAQRIENAGLGVQYAQGSWTGSLGWQLTKLADSIAPANDNRGDLWTVSIGRVLSDRGQGEIPPRWQLSTQISGSFQRQTLASGAETHTDTFTLGLTGQHHRWGQMTGSAGSSRGRTALGEASRMHWYQLEGARRLGQAGSLKLYARDGIMRYGAAFNFRERQHGIQFSHTF